MDAVARFRAASEQNDIDALTQTLAQDAELISPLSGHMVFRGRDDLRILLGAVYGTVTEALEPGARRRQPAGRGRRLPDRTVELATP